MEIRKKINRIEVNYPIHWEYTTIEISKMKEDLLALEKLGATHMDIRSHIEYDSARTDFDAFYYMEETDEELKQRIELENKKQEEIKQRELYLLKKLKEKYGN